MRLALVLGGAACVWSDVEAALDLGEFDGVIACNHIGIHWRGQLDGWASLHADKLKPWAEGRQRRGYPAPGRFFGIGEVPHRFPGQASPGSSGLFALKVALDEMHFDRAVLCGVPMDAEQAHFNIDAPWSAADTYREAWTQALPHIATRARSMGGWTAELLGRPDAAWIAKEI